MADRRAQPREDLLTVIACPNWAVNCCPRNSLTALATDYLRRQRYVENSLSGTIRLMDEFPDQRAMVLEDPTLIPNMSEEALRMVSR